MAETKYGKYIVTELKPGIVEAPWAPKFKPEVFTRFLYLDSEVVEGAFYTECAWYWPGFAEAQDELSHKDEGKSHQHDFDEVLAFFGTNPEDPHDLCAEAEVWLGGEKHVVNKSCLIFLPKGLSHGPIRFTRLDRPVFHFSVGNVKKYG